MIKILHFVLILCMLIQNALADNHDYLTAMDAYDIASDYRESSWRHIEKENPSEEDMQAALKLLLDGVAYLDKPDIKQLANGNEYLHYRRYNIYMDLIHVYLLLGDEKSALYYIRENMYDNFGGSLLSKIDKILLSNVNNKDDFKKIAKILKARRRLSTNKSLNTSYQKNISDAEKIAGLSLFWSTAKRGFVHFDQVIDLDWDKTYLEYIPKVINTKSTIEYYQIMMTFASLLNDSHTKILVPKVLKKHFYSRPPIKTTLIDNRILITHIYSESLRNIGL